MVLIIQMIIIFVYSCNLYVLLIPCSLPCKLQDLLMGYGRCQTEMYHVFRLLPANRLRNMRLYVYIPFCR